MGKQSAFFALYEKVGIIDDAIAEILGIWEDFYGGPTVDGWKDTSDLKIAVTRLDACLEDKQATPIGDEPFRFIRRGVRALEQWISREIWLVDVEASDRELEKSVQLLEQGEETLEQFIQQMAKRAFGYWGARFFSLLKHEEYFREDFVAMMGPNGMQDLHMLLNADDIPDELIDVPTVRILTPLQRNILKVLEGKALKKEALADAVCGGVESSRILYRAGGIKELMELGQVENKRGVGYWSCLSPPLDLREFLIPDFKDTPASTDDLSKPNADDDIPY